MNGDGQLSKRLIDIGSRQADSARVDIDDTADAELRRLVAGLVAVPHRAAG